MPDYFIRTQNQVHPGQLFSLNVFWASSKLPHDINSLPLWHGIFSLITKSSSAIPLLVGIKRPSYCTLLVVHTLSQVLLQYLSLRVTHISESATVVWMYSSYILLAFVQRGNVPLPALPPS